MLIEKGDFIYSKCPLHMIRRKCQLSCPDTRHVNMGRKLREKIAELGNVFFHHIDPKSQ